MPKQEEEKPTLLPPLPLSQGHRSKQLGRVLDLQGRIVDTPEVRLVEWIREDEENRHAFEVAVNQEVRTGAVAPYMQYLSSPEERAKMPDKIPALIQLVRNGLPRIEQQVEFLDLLFAQLKPDVLPQLYEKYVSLKVDLAKWKTTLAQLSDLDNPERPNSS